MQRASTYIEQTDEHIAELTCVHVTLGILVASACVQQLEHMLSSCEPHITSDSHVGRCLYKHVPVRGHSVDVKALNLYILAACRVRETLDFAARVQGVGVKKAELDSLLAKSGNTNAPSDAEVDAFLRVCIAAL